MGIDRDDREEAEARLDWMIREFQDARRRRLVKPDERAVDTHTDNDTKTAVAAPTPSR